MVTERDVVKWKAVIYLMTAIASAVTAFTFSVVAYPLFALTIVYGTLAAHLIIVKGARWR